MDKFSARADFTFDLMRMCAIDYFRCFSRVFKRKETLKSIMRTMAKFSRRNVIQLLNLN